MFRQPRDAGPAVLVAMLSFVVIAMLACSHDTPPEPDSDSQQNYKGGAIPVDDNVYTISGEVVTATESLVRQTDPAQENFTFVNGIGSGSFVGEREAGKGFVRVKVTSAAPSTQYAPPGRIVILKTTDTKAAILVAGDVVTFKCRVQYEAIAAVRENETFDPDKVATYELDYCRLATPIVGAG